MEASVLALGVVVVAIVRTRAVVVVEVSVGGSVRVTNSVVDEDDDEVVVVVMAGVVLVHSSQRLVSVARFEAVDCRNELKRSLPVLVKWHPATRWSWIADTAVVSAIDVSAAANSQSLTFVMGQ